MDNRIAGLLGLAYRGHRLLIGDDALKQLNTGTISLLIVASDSSGNTRKRCQDKATFYEVECINYGSKEELGASLGKIAVSCVGIKDKKLTAKIKMFMKVGEEYDK